MYLEKIVSHCTTVTLFPLFPMIENVYSIILASSKEKIKFPPYFTVTLRSKSAQWLTVRKINWKMTYLISLQLMYRLDESWKTNTNVILCHPEVFFFFFLHFWHRRKDTFRRGFMVMCRTDKKPTEWTVATSCVYPQLRWDKNNGFIWYITLWTAEVSWTNIDSIKMSVLRD